MGTPEYAVFTLPDFDIWQACPSCLMSAVLDLGVLLHLAKLNEQAPDQTLCPVQQMGAALGSQLVHNTAQRQKSGGMCG